MATGCAGRTGTRDSQYTKLDPLLRGMFGSAVVLTRPAGCSETRHGCVLGHHQLHSYTLTMRLRWACGASQVSQSGLDLSQVSGFSVVADKLNFLRYVSHFRSVHRGAFFTTLRTTTVRKLLPESWGFLCPVHTPDGSPCGLLNHLARACATVTEQPDDPAPRQATILRC